MKRKAYGRDTGLTLRMLFTSGLLGLLYVAFALVLFYVLNAGLGLMLVIVIGLAFFQYFTSDKLALAASGAKIVERHEAPELHDMVERLCAMSDLPKPRVAVVDTDVPNAFATGRNPKHAVVAVTTGLWRRLDPKEIEGVLAHELSHIANRDVLIMTVASFFAMLAALLTRIGMYAGFFGGFGGGRDSNNNNAVPVWLFVTLVSIVVYAISFVLIRTISRYREYAADRGSALITGAPEYLMSALQKISSEMFRIPQRDLREVEAMNAFFIIPASVKRSTAELFMSHPPFEKKKLAAPAAERLFALTTAAITLDTECGLKTAGAGAVCFKPLSAGDFVRAQSDLQQLLESVAAEFGSKLEQRDDSFGFSWIVVRDPELEDQVTTVHAVAQGLEEQGFGAQLLAAVFRFDGGKYPVYLIYGYKRGAFWPFVPKGEAQDRDNATELELKAKLEKELPIEQDLTRWFGVFDAPL